MYLNTSLDVPKPVFRQSFVHSSANPNFFLSRIFLKEITLSEKIHLWLIVIFMIIRDIQNTPKVIIQLAKIIAQKINST